MFGKKKTLFETTQQLRADVDRVLAQEKIRESEEDKLLHKLLNHVSEVSLKILEHDELEIEESRTKSQ